MVAGSHTHASSTLLPQEALCLPFEGGNWPMLLLLKTFREKATSQAFYLVWTARFCPPIASPLPDAAAGSQS